MKTRLLVTIFVIVALTNNTFAQEVQSIFSNGKATGGYGALSNKFTYLGGEFANVCEVYGGVFINRRWMVGLAFAGSTNDIRVPLEYSVDPVNPMTYQYGQGGLKLERVFNSNKPFHFVINLLVELVFRASITAMTGTIIITTVIPVLFMMKIGFMCWSRALNLN